MEACRARPAPYVLVAAVPCMTGGYRWLMATVRSASILVVALFALAVGLVGLSLLALEALGEVFPLARQLLALLDAF